MKKYRLRYKVVCWLMGKLNPRESGRLYYKWVFTHIEICKQASIRRYGLNIFNPPIAIERTKRVLPGYEPTCPECGQRVDRIGG